MKKNIFIICLLFSITTKAQKATVTDGASYLGKKYNLGDIIHLGYGSNNNKDFAFVNYGKSVGGINIPGLYHHADVNWSKADVEIEKIEKKSGIVWLRCKPIDKGSSVGSILGSKIFINLEGAVDNNEIKGVSAPANNPDNTHNDNAPTQKEKEPASSQKTEKQTGKFANTNQQNQQTEKQQTTAQKSYSLYIGEYASYGYGGKLLIGLGFILLPGNKYYDLDKTRGGKFVYDAGKATISFKGGFMDGQVGKDVRQSGFQLSSTVHCEPWK